MKKNISRFNKKKPANSLLLLLLVRRTLLEEANKQSLHLLTYFWHGDIIYLSLYVFHSFFVFLFFLSSQWNFLKLVLILLSWVVCHAALQNIFLKSIGSFLKTQVFVYWNLYQSGNAILKNELTGHKQSWVLDFNICFKWVRLVKCWFFCYVVDAHVYLTITALTKKCKFG